MSRPTSMRSNVKPLFTTKEDGNAPVTNKASCKKEQENVKDAMLLLINNELNKKFKDRNGYPISIGDTLVNPDGYEFVVEFGVHKMYCPVDENFTDTVGVYLSNSTYSLESFPLGNTHEWAIIKDKDPLLSQDAKNI